MPAPTPTPPLRYVSQRRLTSPLVSAVGDATHNATGGAAASGDDSGRESVFVESAQLGAAATRRYTHTLSKSEAQSGRQSIEEGEKVGHRDVEVNEVAAPRSGGSSNNSLYFNVHGGQSPLSPSQPPQQPPPPPPSGSPPTGSLAGTGKAAVDDKVTRGETRSSTIDVPATSAAGETAADRAAAASESPPSSLEDCQFILHALRHENQILRQRIEVLTSTDAAAHSPDAEGNGQLSQLPEVPREVLLKRIARLEAALRLEALERDVVEQRLLAQERVLRAVCTPVPLPTSPHNGNIS
jgi:hypothetical protein